MAINLLPPKQKRLTRSVYKTHRLIAVLIVCDLLLLSLIALLAALNIRIKQEKNNNLSALAVLGKKSSVVEFNHLRDEVGLIAKYADVAKANIASSTPGVDYLEQVIISRSNGVNLTNLDFEVDGKGQKILLVGTASSRQALLDFKSKLEALPWVDMVDSPVANLVGDNNAAFSLTVVLIKNNK